MVRHLILPPERRGRRPGEPRKKVGKQGKRKPTPIKRTPLIRPVHDVPADATLPRVLTVAEKRQTAWDLRIQGYSVVDIAAAIDLSESRVSELIREYSADLSKYTEASREEWRTLELARLDKLLVTHWPMRESTKSTQVILATLERKHKLMGLDSTHKHVTVDTPPAAVTLANLDLSKLTNEELGWLEVIIEKAMPVAVVSNVVDAQFEALPNPNTPVEVVNDPVADPSP